MMFFDFFDSSYTSYLAYGIDRRLLFAPVIIIIGVDWRISTTSRSGNALCFWIHTHHTLVLQDAVAP